MLFNLPGIGDFLKSWDFYPGDWGFSKSEDFYPRGLGIFENPGDLCKISGI